MRILVIAKALDRPEAHILVGLKNRGVTVKVLLQEENAHAQILRDSNITILRFPLSSRLDIKGMLALRRIVKSEQIDLVYALSNAALSCANFGLIGLDLSIVTYRGTVGHLSWFDPSSWLTFLNPRVRKILCVSKAVESYLQDLGVSQDKLVTVYKGHDVAWYTAPPTATRSELGVPTDAFVVGCTAVMRAVKGVDILIQACAILLTELPKLHLLLIGPVKDQQVEQLLESFPDKSRLSLTGFRSDATRLATLCDVVVMASKSREGFPKSVIEAMAQGVPAIVTAVGGMPELVDNGAAGLMVEPSNANELAAAIRYLANDSNELRRLGVAGRARIVEVFNIESTVSRMFEIFEELIQKKLLVQPTETA